MDERVMVTRYGSDAVLVSKMEMRYKDLADVLISQGGKAMDLIKDGWDHVVYGMLKFGTGNKVRGVDIMLVPMDDEQFTFMAKRCRNAIIYAKHRRQ